MRIVISDYAFPTKYKLILLTKRIETNRLNLFTIYFELSELQLLCFQ